MDDKYYIVIVGVLFIFLVAIHLIHVSLFAVTRDAEKVGIMSI